MTVELKRTIQEWRNLDPVNIAQRQGRPVAKHALVDAKHDILALAARVEELEDRQHIEIAPPSLSASLVLPEREGAALTSDLSARINRVSRRSLDGTVIMSSEEWNGIVKKVEKLLTAPQPAPDVPGLTEALRQYQHNDGTGLVFGYDKLLVDQYVAGLVEALEQGFPLLSDEGLDEVEHHCEWVIQRERKRVHSILAAYRKGGES